MTDVFLEKIKDCDGVLFDFNGTLSDDEPVLQATYDTALQQLGLEGLRPNEYESLVGLSDPDIVRRLLAARSSDEFDALIGHLSEAYSAAVAERPTITRESARFVAELIDAGTHVAIVTGTFRALMQGGLDQAGLSHIGRDSVAIEDVATGKPDPAGFLLGAENIGVPTDRILGFEDSLAGVEALTRAGIRAVGIGPHLAETEGLIAHFPTMDDAARAYLDT
nr:phosphorylated carbohydrates phosphatase [Streptococcus thermophilus]VDG64673.1 phosphorylated carbohydrates phosphatase [Streptococcus thermophilus]